MEMEYEKRVNYRFLRQIITSMMPKNIYIYIYLRNPDITFLTFLFLLSLFSQYGTNIRSKESCELGKEG